MNLVTLQERLKDFSQQQLVSEMQMPSGQVPQFLLLTELNRRKRMMEQNQLDAAEGDGQTVAQQLVATAGLPAAQAGQMAQNMAPSTNMMGNTGAGMAPQPQAPMQRPPMAGGPGGPVMMREGGIVALQAGGPVRTLGSRLTPEAFDAMNARPRVLPGPRTPVEGGPPVLVPTRDELLEYLEYIRSSGVTPEGRAPLGGPGQAPTAEDFDAMNARPRVLPGPRTPVEGGPPVLLDDVLSTLRPERSGTPRRPRGSGGIPAALPAIGGAMGSFAENFGSFESAESPAPRPRGAEVEVPFRAAGMSPAMGIDPTAGRPAFQPNIYGPDPFGGIQGQSEEEPIAPSSGRRPRGSGGLPFALPEFLTRPGAVAAALRGERPLFDSPAEAQGPSGQMSRRGRTSSPTPEEAQAANAAAAAQQVVAETTTPTPLVSETPRAPVGGTTPTGPAGGGAGTGTGGTGGVGGASEGRAAPGSFEEFIQQRIEGAEADRRRDQWLALAQFGLQLMASERPTLGGAVGEAGAQALESLRGSYQNYNDTMMELYGTREQLAARRAAGAGGGGGGGGGTGFGLSANQGRLLAQYADLEAGIVAQLDDPNLTPARRSQLTQERARLQNERRIVTSTITGLPFGLAESGDDDDALLLN